MPSTKLSTSNAGKETLAVVFKLHNLVANDALWTTRHAADDVAADLEQTLNHLRDLQKHLPSAIPPPRGHADFVTFIDWLASNGLQVESSNFRIGRVVGNSDGADNATLYATSDIATGDHVITVPATVMMTTGTARTGHLGELLASAPALRVSQSIVLTLHLLIEALDAESRFQPYIRVLPARFSIPLALPFSAMQLSSMRPSAAATRALQTWRTQVLQYTNIYLLLISMQRQQSANVPLNIDTFTFDNFIWAVSTVMTRQNALPAIDPTEPPMLALVPAWDMMNHDVGEQTTSVLLDPETGTACVEYSAMKSFAAGDAITMFYGRRPNTELLLYSGFVQSDNAHDKVLVHVPLTANAADKRTAVAKMVLLRKHFGTAVPVIHATDAATRCLTMAGIVGAGGSVSDTLVTIARVAAMKFPEDTRSATIPGAGEADGEAVRILITSIHSLQRQYPKVTGDGEAERLVRALHIEENKLLDKAVDVLRADGI
jgi:hypothetical protein